MSEDATRVRLESVDLLRGIVMILMALDHTRDFLGVPGNPTNLAQTTAALFFTRWITHFCAPVFFLLTGVGARLSLVRKSRRGLSAYLLTRGLWLIFLEVVVLRGLAWQFNFDFRFTMLLILWALGWAMITLAALVYLPAWLSTAFGLALIAGHNLFDSVRNSSWVWTVLHVPGFLSTDPRHAVFVGYPLVPWIGVTAAGYGLGQIYDWPAERRRRFLFRMGAALTTGFILLRALNIYGDPVRWAPQKTAVLTLMSFLNTNKYPPSLLFLLMTLGPALLALGAFDGATPLRPFQTLSHSAPDLRFLRPALVFGKVPLFYFALHTTLIHLLAVCVCYFRYGQVHWMFESPDVASYPITAPPGWGLALPQVYLAWVFVVVALYPLCRWFAALKRRRKDVWLSYL